MPKLPPPSPFLSSALQASPHLNQLTKAIALKSHKKRFIFIIVSISLILFYYWTPSQGGIREQIEGVELNSKECKFLTWRKKCQSTVAEEDLSPVDYEIKAGQLFYPGTLELEGDFTGEQEIPAQAHPIHLLMEQAQKNWTEKVNKQSKTLHEAVAEYEKRYGMRPPRGFSEWYWFAKGHGVTLIDEYDSISSRILPFLAVPSAVLQERSNQLQNDKEFWMANNAFTITVRNGGKKVNVVGPMKHTNTRPEQMLSLLEGISKWLPDMNITITGHDSPWVMISGESKENHIAAAKAGKLLTEAEYSDPLDNWDYDGFSVICPPGSPIRSVPGFDSRKDDWVIGNDSFIQDHLSTMDLCQHPEQQPIHGFTGWTGPRPGLLYPMFTLTTTTIHSDFLVPPIDQYEREVGPDPEWANKTIEQVLWRGTTTGADLGNDHHKAWSQRVRLCRLFKHPGALTLPLSVDTPERTPAPLTYFTALAKTLANHYFDFKFLSPPQQCGDNCESLLKMFEWDSYMSESNQNLRKYVIDVDGNGWSGRFHRLMASNSLVLKSTIFPEWYTERIQPWFHYVPVAVDYSDLWSIMAFFRGDLDGNGAHDELANQIAQNGKVWVEEMWHWSDMQAYFYRLLLEYARVMERDPDNPTNMDM